MSQGLQVCNAGGLCRAMSGILKALMPLDCKEIQSVYSKGDQS